ncbi:MAG: sugar phosphate nucleotidyltransferase [Gemmatimonadetes bacterium]|jgi:glucose-1-phosphate thymidylyltransferase|nr:sugar phosphate nucleotidyltransferase [Gemmatimonadota bacterium]
MPLAGKGTRLRPHTLHTPKALMRVAGKPVLSFLLDDLIALGVDEMVFIVGYLRDEVEAWIRAEYPNLRGHYVVQEIQDGTAGAIALAEPFIDEEVLIVFPDAVLEVDYGLIATLDDGHAGVIWAKEVEDYQRYGVIVTDEAGDMARIIEKPSEPISKLANIGMYYIRDHELLFEGVRHTLAADPGAGGEFFLTDAFQYMVDHGAKLLPAPVRGWWDAGKPETLLDTNAHLIERDLGGIDATASVEGAEIVEPVRIEAGAIVLGGSIGPHVTIESGARVEGSQLRNAIIGAGAKVVNCDLGDSLVGAGSTVQNCTGSISVTDFSTIVGGERSPRL